MGLLGLMERMLKTLTNFVLVGMLRDSVRGRRRVLTNCYNSTYTNRFSLLATGHVINTWAEFSNATVTCFSNDAALDLSN